MSYYFINLYVKKKKKKKIILLLINKGEKPREKHKKLLIRIIFVNNFIN